MSYVSGRCHGATASAISVGVLTRAASGNREAGAAVTTSGTMAACLIAGIPIRLVAGAYFTNNVFSDHSWAPVSGASAATVMIVHFELVAGA